MGVNKLTPDERDKIARLDSQGCGVRQIARRLKRSPSTVSTELRAGTWHDHNVHTSVYVAIHAQNLRNKRSQNSHQHSRLHYEPLRAYVETHIHDGWSPELISGRLVKEFPDDARMRVSYETIYAYIYGKEQAELKLWEYSPRKQTKRHHRPGRKVHRGHIPDRVSIHERPEAVSDRSQFGNWEGDSIEGKRVIGDGIHTELERLSRKLLARKVARIASAETIQVQLAMFATLPAAARRSTTLDNGRENHAHSQLRSQLGMATYFADPYSSWQRGSNEWHNGLIRRYLPKQTDFTNLTQAELDDIVEEINNRPRKVLGFKTPNEVYSEQLAKSASVRIRT